MATWRALVGSGVAVALAVPFVRCSFGGGDFACTSDTQCAGGVCEPTHGFCAFADSSCVSGFRFGDYAGGVSHLCTDQPPPADAPRDVSVSEAGMEAGVACYGTGLAVVCFATAPTDTVVLPGTIDTSPGSAACSTAAMNVPDLCVIAGATITVPSTTVATGARPLVLVAVTTISVYGALDVSSVRNPARTGAGHPTTGCNAGTTPGPNGGGAGGSYGSRGGDGGRGASFSAAGIAGNGLPAALHGGCDGQAGASGGTSGTGGGAVYLIADGSIGIGVTGSIDASGAGGGGGASGGGGGGGGGGGAGGLVGLDAPTIANLGTVFANGGGGGEGGDNGATGHAGREATTEAAAAGGTGGTGGGGDGGNGAAVGAAQNGSGGAGGGGGGGGAGYLKVFRGALGGRRSPNPS